MEATNLTFNRIIRIWCSDTNKKTQICFGGCTTANEKFKSDLIYAEIPRKIKPLKICFGVFFKMSIASPNH